MKWKFWKSKPKLGIVKNLGQAKIYRPRKTGNSPTINKRVKKSGMPQFFAGGKFALWLKICLIVILVLGLGFWLFKSDLLAVREINVQFVKSFCQNEIEIRQQIKLDKQNWFTLNTSSLTDELLQKNHCLEQVDVKREWFNRVEIRLIGRTPEAVMQLVRITPGIAQLIDVESSASSQTAILDFSDQIQPEGDNYWVDRFGKIFMTEASPSSLPKYFMIERELVVGKSLNSRLVLEGNRAVVQMNLLGLVPNWVKITNHDVFLAKMKDGLEVVIALDEDVLRQTASLQLILQKAKIDSKSINRVDLRFDKPVVIYKNK